MDLPRKASSHFGDFVQRFPWSSLLRPAASIRMLEETAYAGDERKLGNGVVKMGTAGSGKEDTEEFHEAESMPTEDAASLSPKIHALESMITDIFAIISSLKYAYIQLQAAHSPFDAEKLRVADKAVIVELKKLSELKHMFREKHSLSSHRYLNQSGNLNLIEQEKDVLKKLQDLESVVSQKQKIIENYEEHIGNLQKQMEERKTEIEILKDSFKRVLGKKEKLEKRLKKREQKSVKELLVNGMQIDTSPTPQTFDMIVQGTREGISSFTKLLVSMLKEAQWDLDAAANSIEPGIFYARPRHKCYAFESYVSRRMFSGFENENFYIDGSLSSILDPEKYKQECFLQFQELRSADPVQLITSDPDCLFGKFCQKKYLQVIHEKMEHSFFGNFDHREQILNGCHPQTKFYQSFLRLAKTVWLVHRLAFSFDPTVSIFQARKNEEFDPAFMDSVTQDSETTDSTGSIVGFMVMPGFHVEKWAIRCVVYLTSTLSDG